MRSSWQAVISLLHERQPYSVPFKLDFSQEQECAVPNIALSILEWCLWSGALGLPEKWIITQRRCLCPFLQFKGKMQAFNRLLDSVVSVIFRTLLDFQRIDMTKPCFWIKCQPTWFLKMVEVRVYERMLCLQWVRNHFVVDKDTLKQGFAQKRQQKHDVIVISIGCLILSQNCSWIKRKFFLKCFAWKINCLLNYKYLVFFPGTITWLPQIRKVLRLPVAHAQVPPFIKLNTYKLYYGNYKYTH